LSSDSIILLADYLGLKTSFDFSSNIFLKNEVDLSGAERILSLCEYCNADIYLNLKGGEHLYAEQFFLSHNTRLKFIQMKGIIYPQRSEKFIPSLSVIDCMMYNSTDNIKSLLRQSNFS
jgi:hypothetical protein